MNPSDFYFCVSREDQAFCLTSIEYWKARECLDDCLSDIDCLPSKFHNSMEAMWEYRGSLEEGRKALEEAGFIFCPEMDEFINNYQP